MNIPDQPMAVSHEIHTYTELRHQIHRDLRIQHPEWILPNGESPMCDFYEARLIKSFPTSIPTKYSGNMVAVSDLPTSANAKNSSVVIFS